MSFVLQYNHRNGRVNNSISTPLGYTYTNQNVAALSRWKQAHDISSLPAATVTSTTPYSYFSSSDFNWGDASFIKFKTLSFSWSLPKALIQRIKFREASVFLQGQNLYTWAKQKYTLDPETTVGGTGPSLGTGTYIAMPQLRTIVAGLNISF
jgi:hypothetical protein